MIFWILVAAFVGCLVWYKKVDYFNNTLPGMFSVLLGIATAVALATICVNIIPAEGAVKSSEARYESLVCQYENNMYDNDNDIGKKELMNQIQDWNEDLAFGKEMQNNFWIGIFIPNVFDQFEPISLE